MTSEEIKNTQTGYVLQSWSKQRGLNPIPIVKAEGIYMWDTEGIRYSDMSAQLVNLNVGHGNRYIIDAIKEQAEQYCYISPSYASEPRGELAKMLIERLPDNMGKIFFTNGGADANENAVKMARMYTGRNKVFSRYRSYHGSTFGAGNLTGEPRRYPLEPGIPGFVKFFDPYLYRETIPFESEEAAAEYYVSKLREQICYEGANSVAAIVLETITGSNGIIIPPKGYLKGIRQICDDYGIMLICDEVMAGFGRTGKMFAFENFDIKPDMVTFAKGVTCGYVQLGGVAVSKDIADYFNDNFLSCGLTYSGHPLACAAGIACLKFYDDEKILDHVNEVSKVLGEELEALKEKHPSVGDVRYIGLFSAVELVKDKETKEALVPYGGDSKGIMKSIIGRLSKKGFMTYSHENMILIAPPLIITSEQIREELKKVDEVLSEVDKEILE
ncbi:aminotransferase class III-fold pyridoxal phosphate-dependent enzyme [Anaerocolumna sp. AGMB13025]|uniref:aminotransferase class III-fold pyridoxal phosphate-dependent enzyme n=1 Tax=Anaerocolumna sp. AGMB13025 TaxID=3039116 RepID=UPI00241DBC45|nr:aminotransferase class III-fold pyridoxal phosphate-dependent enzyme [Anaerocolumna sp. AGMB13025]WFR56157.1 aminotransferase class III-fold pyridoxal phosphate-dependent enzyme [Anaerocolumna sp. AGMB13025]